MKHTLFLFLLLTISASTFSHSIERNVFIVLISTYNQLLVDGTVMDIKDLKDSVKEYVANPNNDESLAN